MAVNQREIVDIKLLFPDCQFKPHPAIVISNNELFEDEGFFYCVLLSSKIYNEQYIFKLSNEMLTKPSKKESFVKCHIIGGFTEKDILGRFGYIKSEPFEKLKSKIIQSIF